MDKVNLIQIFLDCRLNTLQIKILKRNVFTKTTVEIFLSEI